MEEALTAGLKSNSLPPCSSTETAKPKDQPTVDSSYQTCRPGSSAVDPTGPVYVGETDPAVRVRVSEADP